MNTGCLRDHKCCTQVTFYGNPEIENILVETKKVQEDALSPFAAQIVLEHYFKNKAILFVTFHFSIIKSIRLYDQTLHF
jgi:hypothetical protein